MAVIKLTIHAFLADIEAVKVETISMVTGTDTAQVGNYLYSLVGLSMNKQMYQPTKIVADISINKTEGTKWAPIKRTDIVEMFRFCRITLHGDDDVIGDDYYVHEVIPEYRTGSMVMRLHIFSLDKLLTLKQTSRSFVGKKLLGDILAKELPKYLLPFNKGKSMEFKTEDRIKTVQQLVYQNAAKTKVEHIFPYLVQYNESFYDLLARTTNRWGEFMYYEDGNLQIGYNAEAQVKIVQKYDKITYSCQDASLDLLGNIKDGNYEAEAAYDKNIYDAPVPKSPLFVRGELGKFNGYGDKYAMKKIASFFNTDKNVISWAVNTLVDDGVSVLQAMSSTKLLNNEVNKKYFPEKDKVGTAEQYGTYKFTLYDEETESKDGFNEFTEITSQYANNADYYDASRYGKVLEFEQEAGNNMVFIDFDTTWPGLKLGQIIEVDGERFIVVNISATYKDNKLTFQAKAIGAHVSEVGGKKIYQYYPAMIPSGHVRYSGPQLAKIKDAADPTFSHRVRVVFPWQGEADNVDKKDATPWITFATKGDGKTTTGKHNAGDEVMVGFVDGNVERPYVMGALQTKVAYDQNLNVDFDTPGGHHMRLTDGTGAGLAKFVTSALSPIAETFFNFVPAPIAGKLFSDKSAFSGNKYFEGGFSLSDYYGIYKISGSTDKRNISISSPWGDVKLDAFTGITISAPNGDVKIKGKNVTIEAGNNLKLESGTNIGWKLGNDKKFGDFSLASLGLTVAGAIANKVAEKFKPVDLKIVRSVVEVVMRPVEGALTVKSHRYMMLEAGKNECEYPKYAFNEEKKKKLVGKEDDKKNEKTLYVPDGFVEVFDKAAKLVEAMHMDWGILYNSCLTKKLAFEKAVKELQSWSNDDKERPCKTIEELKDKLWDPDTKKVELDGDDLGFKENVKDHPDNVDKSLENKGVDTVVSERAFLKIRVVAAAKALRAAIIQVLAFKWTQEKVNEAVGGFKSTILPGEPAKIKEAMFKAITNESCKDFFICKPDDDVKALKEEVKLVLLVYSSVYKRLVCLSLIKELKLDKNRDTKVEEPTKDNIEVDSKWRDYVNSLSYVPEKNKEKPSLGSTLGTPFKKWLTDEIDNLNFKKSYNEMYAWADGNNGDILIGTNENTYAIKGGGRSATFDRVTSFNHEAQLKKIKDKLLGI
jgi:hypothetical protein